MENESMVIGMTVAEDDPVASLEKVSSLGISTCQMYVPSERWWSKGRLGLIKKVMQEKGVRITALVCHFEGERYDDIATVKRTVGLLNQARRERRVRRIIASSDFAKNLGVKVLLAHIGLIPQDRNKPDYKGLVKAMQRIADYCKRNGQSFALETGQEKARNLAIFIEDVNRPNLGVNFDPANMLLYDAGDPIEALDILGKYVIGVHCKDGKRPIKKGQLGKEYPLGEGDVDIRCFIEKLKEIGYKGPLTIEREIAGERQRKDIIKAKELLEKLMIKVRRYYEEEY